MAAPNVATPATDPIAAEPIRLAPRIAAGHRERSPGWMMDWDCMPTRPRSAARNRWPEKGNEVHGCISSHIRGALQSGADRLPPLAEDYEVHAF